MEENGLSLLDVWKLILKKKMIGCITFGITTVIFLVLILFVYNPLMTNYEATFNYRWLGIENNKYANGTLFNYYDIVSLENLKAVKDSNPAYQKIDVEGLSERIKIEATERDYIIHVPGVYFNGNNQAKAFIEDLIYIPYHKALHLNFDFKANLVGYERSKKLSTKLTYLDNQINMIMEGYQSMISYFGDIQIGNSNLSSLYRNIEAFSSNDSIKEYEYLAYQNYYMTKEEFETSLKEKEALLTEQGLLRERKKVLLESLKNIYTNSNGNTYMDTAIANYLNSLHTLDTRLMSIDESLKLIEGASLGEYNEQESEAFLKTLDEYKTELEKYTEEYTNSVGDVLKETTLMNLHSLQAKGKISVFLAIPASILVGIISGIGMAFLVAFIESNKKNEEII